ncbi:MAG: Hsp33 family molecular chaperone HslO [Victivallaceae bacterium]|nr:Hsp33 family molecular chaperone HslO [Victivallaceae bacterium]
MNNRNFLIRGVIKPLNARYTFVNTTSLVAEAIKRHDLDPISSIFLSQSLTTGALVSPLLEGDEEYTLRWDYAGALGTIIVNLNGRNELRGYIKEPHLANITDDRNALFGDSGSISVVKSLEGKILNSGASEAGLLDVTEDVGFFFSTSDQIETQIVGDIKFNIDPANPVKTSAGFMLQAMPDCDLAEFDLKRQRMLEPQFLDTLLDSALAKEERLTALLHLIDADLSTADYTLTESTAPEYRCKCSHDKMLNAVKLLDKAELIEMFKTNDAPRICCQFCGDEYSFTTADFDLNIF